MTDEKVLIKNANKTGAYTLRQKKIVEISGTHDEEKSLENLTLTGGY